MNPLDELRTARPAHLGDVPVDPRTRQTELSYAFAQVRSAPRRNLKPIWGLGLAGAAAAATAVAVFSSGIGAGTVPRAPSTIQAEAPPVEISAKQLLLVAATSAESQPAPTGKYWHIKSQSRSLLGVEGGYAMASESQGETWTTDGRQWSTSQSLGLKPATDADRAAWEAAGSPSTMTITGGKQITTAAGKPYSSRYNNKYIYWLGHNVTLADLRALPSDEAELKASILKYYEGHDTESNLPMSEDAWLFRVASGLVIDGPVSPQVRAAAFRMLAALPSVTSLGQVTDSTGRPGTAIAIETDSQIKVGDPNKGILQERVIIDEKSGRALARESVVIKPGGFQAGLKAGTIANAYTIIESDWTDTRTS
ncbi:CU044_5270 family protein [Acrocarpospora macrocephala]|uniref:CU044_5270 family protein n=1 Tax=Acrocarpospora macrocephala TaxID=150177 RepID=A0A5M3XCE4_9ACTN|nr:CU044_5270 family protein [Acrocarpospora macrocephala]GES16543.1 hypothetical protein Amac_101410 [Acrocarpospora macrocephala]